LGEAGLWFPLPSEAVFVDTQNKRGFGEVLKLAEESIARHFKEKQPKVLVPLTLTIGESLR
jgi:hypothetical protein